MACKGIENNVSVNQNLSNKLLSCLYSQRKTGKFCDIILNVGGIKFSVHSCVLASFSPYFNDLLLSPSSEIFSAPMILEQNKNCHQNDCLSKDILEHWSLKNPLQFTLPLGESSHGRSKMDCSDCTCKVLDFMYLGKIQIQKDHVEHIKLLSTILKITELLLICEKFNLKHKRKSNFDSTEIIKRKQKGTITCELPVMNEPAVKLGIEIIKPEENLSCTRKISGPGSENKALSIIENTNQVHFEKAENTKNDFPQVPLSEGNKDSVKSPTDYKVENTKAADQFICSLCKLKFSSPILLRQHRETHRGRLYTCYACRFSSHKAFDLVKHLLDADHQETVCSLCFFEAESSEKLKDHLKMHNHPEPFFCSICNVRFHNRAALNTHTPKHSTEMPFSCNVCNRGFKWKQGLQSHMTVHTPEKKHLCPECGFSTAYQSTFRAHTLVHTSNMFACQHAGCSFKTVRKHNYVSHLKTHTKEKPYQCEVCGQSYSQAKNLRRHAVKHDAVAEESIEHCPLCLYQTMRVDKLKIHFRKHHPEGDETLLNLQRRKRRMLNLPKNSANNSEKLDHENIAKTVIPLNDKPNQASNKQNTTLQANAIPMIDLQTSTTNALFTMTTLNTSKINNGKDMPKSINLPVDSVVRNEEMIILFDTSTSQAILVPTAQPFVMHTLGNINSSESANKEPERNSVQVGNLPFRTEQCESLLRTDNLINTCINPKLLFIDNAHGPEVGENLLKNGKETIKSQSLLSLDSLSMNTRYEDTFTNSEISQSILDEASVFSNSVSNLINEQINKEEPTLDLINNNVIQELFPDSTESSGLEDTTNMLDILTKEVPSLVVLDRSKDQMLLCHETISDDIDNAKHKTLNKDCSNQVLQSFESFESILESL
ncbi:hypothetical protein L9F63_021423 [Diploptera punctata]|uniref:Uncharacterized protein n=1 Tax=Diploptera punctata TaxID=6984 RepID=A0AAD8EBH7_DIPPU|nr:hypothetical protein L9F63_021423 [Diploptera punctata]